MRAYIAAAGVLAAIPLFAALQDTHEIKWNPKVGEKSTYKLEVDGSMEIPSAGPMDMHFELLTESVVKEITDEKITVVGKMLDMKILVGGNDVMGMGGGPDPEEMKKEVTETFNRRGERLSTTDTGEMGSERFDRMTQFIYPDKPLATGDSWTLDIKGSKEKNLPPARSKYTFKGMEEIDGKQYFRIDYAFSELEGAKPMGAMGVMHLDPENGRPFRIKADVNDAQFAEEMPPTNVKFLMQLQK
jgi:hypothetical protein